MSEDYQQQFDRIESLIRIHRCETAALVYEVTELANHVRMLLKTVETKPKVPIGMIEVPNTYTRFLEQRKEYLQRDLEKLEKLDPGSAARLQEIIYKRGEEFSYAKS